MSDATRDALDAAIRAHIADEYDNNLTASWIVIAEHILPEDDGDTHVVDVVPDNQSAITSIGLTHYVVQARTGQIRST